MIHQSKLVQWQQAKILMCFMSLTYLCLCWTKFFDNITFHTVRVLHIRSYMVSLSAE